MHTSPVNPFYAARTRRFASDARPEPAPQRQPEQSVYVKLPRVPINGSPVPHLTSLYHNAEAGDYGDRGYPGNCGGNLIKDFLRYFRPSLLFDPMAGSGPRP